MYLCTARIIKSSSRAGGVGGAGVSRKSRHDLVVGLPRSSVIFWLIYSILVVSMVRHLKRSRNLYCPSVGQTVALGPGVRCSGEPRGWRSRCA